MDGAEIRIGNNVFIGPCCGFYTATHPLDYKSRNKGWVPISIGDNCWLGANVSVMPGVGIVVNGQLIRGSSNLAGELQFTSKEYEGKVTALQTAKAGVLKLMTNHCLAITSVVDPDLIVIYTELLDDLRKLEENIAKVLPKDTGPKLLKVAEINEYIMLGILQLALL